MGVVREKERNHQFRGENPPEEKSTQNRRVHLNKVCSAGGSFRKGVPVPIGVFSGDGLGSGSGGWLGWFPVKNEGKAKGVGEGGGVG